MNAKELFSALTKQVETAVPAADLHEKALSLAHEAERTSSPALERDLYRQACFHEIMAYRKTPANPEKAEARYILLFAAASMAFFAQEDEVVLALTGFCRKGQSRFLTSHRIEDCSVMEKQARRRLAAKALASQPSPSC